MSSKSEKKPRNGRQLFISITCIVIIAALLITSLITLLPIYQ
jgi:type IV secretory pathway component VirB8